MSNVVFCFGQFTGFTGVPNGISKNNLPDKIKTIKEFQDDLLLTECVLDTVKNVLFYRSIQSVSGKRNGKYITLITGYIYDDFGKVIKSYGLHSNVGLSIVYYEYDSVGNNIKRYRRDNRYEHHDSLINTSPYSYISEIKSFEELVNYSKIKEIEMVAQKYLLSESIFDSIGNLITEISYRENGDTADYKRYEYDKDNDKVFSYYESSKDFYTENYYEYEKKYLYHWEDEDLLPIFEKSNLLQNVRFYYDRKENRKRISYTMIDKYDNKDRLIESIYYDKGKFQSRDILEYNSLNQLTKRITYEVDKIASEEIYLYDKKGNVTEYTYNNIRLKEKKVKKYYYDYYE